MQAFPVGWFICFFRAFRSSVFSPGDHPCCPKVARIVVIATCMRCMHQKTDYALYAGTQLRKRLHTMHTGRRFGSGVGLKRQKCMQSGMHTDCIQSAYKHIKSKKGREFFFYFFFIARASSSAARDSRAIISSLLALSGMHGPHHASLPVLLGRIAATFGGLGRLPTHVTCMHCMHQKTDYACYARTQLRKRLHTMHTETRIGVSVGLRG